METSYRQYLNLTRDPQKHISISILWGYLYLIGLHFEAGYMRYPYPTDLCLCAFLGLYPRSRGPKTRRV